MSPVSPEPAQHHFVSQYKTGDEVTVTVNGRKFITVFHGQGLQTFKENPIMRDVFNAWFGLLAEAGETDSVNVLIKAGFESGSYTIDNFLTYYSSIGLPVDNLFRMRSIPKVIIRNPVWEEQDYSELSNQAWAELMALIGEPYEHNGNEAVRHIFDVVRSGAWKTVDGVFTSGTQTIDRVVVEFLRSRNIDPYLLDAETEGMLPELSGFLTHLRTKPFRAESEGENAL